MRRHILDSGVRRFILLAGLGLGLVTIALVFGVREGTDNAIVTKVIEGLVATFILGVGVLFGQHTSSID